MTSIIDGPYAPNDAYNKWYVEDGEVQTLDLLIGEESMLGKGLSHQMIQAFLLDKFSHASRILIDPAEENTKAIHVYEKAGFKKMEKYYPDYDPIPHWVMILEMKNLMDNTN